MGNRFSSRRIESPGERLLSMHPFVDVLEGRTHFCASVHGGLMWFNGRAYPMNTGSVARAVLRCDERAGVFCNDEIDEVDSGEAAPFAHAFPGRTAAKALPAPAVETHPPDVSRRPPRDVFRRDRAMSGTVNPYLVALARSRNDDRPFAA